MGISPHGSHPVQCASLIAQYLNKGFEFQPMVGNLLPTRIFGFGFPHFLPLCAAE
jgi:hypothetical protein